MHGFMYVVFIYEHVIRREPQRERERESERERQRERESERASERGRGGRGEHSLALIIDKSICVYFYPWPRSVLILHAGGGGG